MALFEGDERDPAERSLRRKRAPAAARRAIPALVSVENRQARSTVAPAGTVSVSPSAEVNWIAETFFRVVGTIGAWLSFYLLRLGERIFSPWLFAQLLWRATLFCGLLNFEKHRKIRRAWERFPSGRRRAFSRYFFQQTVGLLHARTVYTWPDRLLQPRCLQRCDFRGDADAFRDSARPIVFVSLHFGPFETLPYWLRAFRIPATTLVGRAAARQRLKNRQYSLSPPSDVPVVIPVTDGARLRRTVECARHLLTFLDVQGGKQTEISLDDGVWRLATGPIRAAVMRRALLIPCLIVASHPWRYAIHFGSAVDCDSETLAAGELGQIAMRLRDSFAPVLAASPTQWTPRLLSSIRREPVENSRREVRR